MAPFQSNKDLISTGIKEFNVLLDQQVSLCTLFQGQRWRECVLEGQSRLIWNLRAMMTLIQISRNGGCNSKTKRMWASRRPSWHSTSLTTFSLANSLSSPPSPTGLWWSSDLWRRHGDCGSWLGELVHQLLQEARAWGAGGARQGHDRIPARAEYSGQPVSSQIQDLSEVQRAPKQYTALLIT